MVRIEVVDPEKQRAPACALKEREHAVRGFERASLRLAGGGSVVVEVEAACKAELFREGVSGDESGRPIAGLPQPFGKKGLPVAEVARILMDAVSGGVEPRHHRRVGGEGLRDGGISAQKAAPTRG